MPYNTIVNIDRRTSPLAASDEQQDGAIKATNLTGATDLKGKEHQNKALQDFFGSDDEHSIKSYKSIINPHTSVSFHSIYGYYRFPGDSVDDYTFLYDDFKRGTTESRLKEMLDDAKNPTVYNIMKWYGTNKACAYRESDFVYLKYINKIPLNRMITLRRYPLPTYDKMFILGSQSGDNSYDYLHNSLGWPSGMTPVSTAVTFASELAGNNLGDILSYSYGMQWESKEADVQTIERQGLTNQSHNSQFTKFFGANAYANVGGGVDLITAFNGGLRGYSGQQVWALQHMYQGDYVKNVYGDDVFGPVNAITSTTIRKRGLQFSSSFTLKFTYSLKALKYVNPKIALIDILCNFMLLTGNYGNFWGGATRYFIPPGELGPEFGDLDKLKRGDFYGYFQSASKDVSVATKKLTGGKGFSLDGVLNAVKTVAQNGLSQLIGNALGSFTGQDLVEKEYFKALLKSNPTGYWHLVIGNPLNPIAVMGNMIVKDTKVSFSNVLGEDDFPNEVTFEVSLEHGKPRDIGGIQSMYNYGHGRIYVDMDPKYEAAMNRDDRMIAYRDVNNRYSSNIKKVTTPTVNGGYWPADWGSIGDATNAVGRNLAWQKRGIARSFGAGVDCAYQHGKQEYNYATTDASRYDQYSHEYPTRDSDIAIAQAKLNIAANKLATGGQ